MDEYFPEYTKAFKKILSRTSEEILKRCPFPEDIKSLGKEELLKHTKETERNDRVNSEDKSKKCNKNVIKAQKLARVYISEIFAEKSIVIKNKK